MRRLVAVLRHNAALISRGSDEKGGTNPAVEIRPNHPHHRSASMFDALMLMAEKNIGALLIMEGETIVRHYGATATNRRISFDIAEG